MTSSPPSSADAAPGADAGSPSRGWPRALALLGVALVTSVAQPSVLIGVAFLALAAVFGMRRVGVVLLAILAVVVVTGGAERDGVWFLERAWALMVGGAFAALTLRRPDAAFSRRAIGSVAAAAGFASALLMLESGAWQTLDWTVRDRMSTGVETALEALQVLQRGDPLSPAVVTALYEAVDAQASVFPAMLGIASMASLGVAWWAYRRLAADDDQGLGPLRGFRFNDHLVWVFIGGLVLLVARGGDVLGRVGANVVVFMGALYAVRGAAVIMFLSGGLSFFGYVLLALGVVLVPPLVLTGALVIGIGDTWLDVRTRVRDLAA